jgi:hypothetical protein
MIHLNGFPTNLAQIPPTQGQGSRVAFTPSFLFPATARPLANTSFVEDLDSCWDSQVLFRSRIQGRSIEEVVLEFLRLSNMIIAIDGPYSQRAFLRAKIPKVSRIECVCQLYSKQKKLLLEKPHLLSIEELNPELFRDDEFIQEIISQFPHLSFQLKTQSPVFIFSFVAVASRNPSILKEVDRLLVSDVSLCLEILQFNSDAWLFLPTCLTENCLFIIEAVKRRSEILARIPFTYLEYEKVCLETVSYSFETLKHVDPRHAVFTKLALDLAATHPETLKSIPDTHPDLLVIAEKSIHFFPFSIRYLNVAFKDYEKLAILAVSKNSQAFLQIPTSHRTMAVCLAALKGNPALFTIIPEEFKIDTDILFETLVHDPYMAGFCRRDVLTPSLLERIAEKNGSLIHFLPTELVDYKLLEKVFEKQASYVISYFAHQGKFDEYVIFEEARLRALLVPDKILTRLKSQRNLIVRGFVASYIALWGRMKALETIESFLESRQFAFVPVLMLFSLGFETHPLEFYATHKEMIDSFFAFLKKHRHAIKNKLSLAEIQLINFIGNIQTWCLPPKEKLMILKEVVEFEDPFVILNLLNIWQRLDPQLGKSLKPACLKQEILEDALMAKLIRLGYLEEKNSEGFKKEFLASRYPHAIFLYVAQHLPNPVMYHSLRGFINSVSSKTFNLLRLFPTVHLKKFSNKIIMKWNQPVSHSIEDRIALKLDFEILDYLKTKFIVEDLAPSHFKQFKSWLNDPFDYSQINMTKTQKLFCQILSGDRDPVEILEVLASRIHFIGLTSLPIYAALNEQVMRLRAIREGSPQLKLIDSADWDSLFYCGTQLSGSCQMIGGNPELNQALLGYTNDFKCRVIQVIDPKGDLLSRSIIKLLTTSDKKPAFFVEPPYPNNDYGYAILKLAAKKSMQLNIPFFIEGSSEPLISFGVNAPCEYEDSHRLGLTDGSYTIWGDLP